VLLASSHTVTACDLHVQHEGRQSGGPDGAEPPHGAGAPCTRLLSGRPCRSVQAQPPMKFNITETPDARQCGTWPVSRRAALVTDAADEHRTLLKAVAQSHSCPTLRYHCAAPHNCCHRAPARQSGFSTMNQHVYRAPGLRRPGGALRRRSSRTRFRKFVSDLPPCKRGPLGAYTYIERCPHSSNAYRTAAAGGRGYRAR